MAGEGFEPSKAEPPDLQSGPFDRSGTPPALVQTATRKSSDRGAARAGSAAVAWTQVLARVAEPLRLGQRLELLQRVVLDLPDPLARDVERAPDLLERPRPSAREPEAHLDDLALALRQGRQRAMDVLLAEVLRGDLERRLRRLVLDEVAELGLVLLADRLLERDRLLGHPQDVAHLARRALELGGDLFRRRLAAERLDELALDVHDLVELLDHVDRDANRPALVGDRSRHGLADPPRRVRRELVAAAIVELLDRADQPRRPPRAPPARGAPAGPAGGGRGPVAPRPGCPWARGTRRGGSASPCARWAPSWRRPSRRGGWAPCGAGRRATPPSAPGWGRAGP